MKSHFIDAMVASRYILLFLTISSLSFAADPQGSYQPLIEGKDGRPIANALVTLTGTHFHQASVTRENGQTHFPRLKPGTYNVTVTLKNSRRDVAFPQVLISRGALIQQTLIMQTHSPNHTKNQPNAVTKKQDTLFEAEVSSLELEALPQSGDPWGLLETIPGLQIDRVSVAGRDSHSQGMFSGFGDDGRNSQWLLDGIDFTSHANEGTPLAFIDFWTLTDVSVTTGGAHVSQSGSGTAVNFKTKQGTNEHRGHLRLLFADENLVSKNSDNDFLDSFEELFVKGVEISGPIIKDKFWYWGAFRQSSLDQISTDSEIENLNLKLHGNLTPTTQTSVFYSESDRVDAYPIFDFFTQESSSRLLNKTPISKFDIQQAIGSHTMLKATYARVDGSFDSVPNNSPNNAQPVFDQRTGRWQNSFVEFSISSPKRIYQITGETQLGNHRFLNEFNYGFEYKKAWHADRQTWGSEGSNIWVRDYSSIGRTSYFHAHRDQVSKTELESTSFWLQDTISFDNLTLELGLRYNQSEANNSPVNIPGNPFFPDAVQAIRYEGDDPEFDYQTLSPKLGIAYRFGDQEQFLVRGSYRRYYDDLSINEVQFLNPARQANITGFAQDFNGDGQYDRNELGFALDAAGNVIPYLGNEESQDPYLFTTFGFSPNDPRIYLNLNSVDPDLNPPKVDEFIVEGQWELPSKLTFGLRLTKRERSDTHRFRRTKGPDTFISREDYQLHSTLTGTHPETGQPYEVDYYVLTPGIGLEFVQQHQHLTNRPAYSEDFESAIFSFEKPFSHRWFLRGHLALQDWNRNVGPESIINPTPDATRTNVDGASVANASFGEGRKSDLFPGTARWSANVSSMYEFPFAIRLGATLLAQEGYLAPITITPSGFNSPFIRAESGDFSIGDGSFRYGDLYNLNLQVSKDFQLGLANLGVSLGLFNVFNEDTVLQFNRDYGFHTNNGESVQNFNDPGAGTVRSTYRQPSEILDPRTLQISAQLSF